MIPKKLSFFGIILKLSPNPNPIQPKLQNPRLNRLLLLPERNPTPPPPTAAYILSPGFSLTCLPLSLSLSLPKVRYICDMEFFSEIWCLQKQKQKIAGRDVYLKFLPLVIALLSLEQLSYSAEKMLSNPIPMLCAVTSSLTRYAPTLIQPNSLNHLSFRVGSKPLFPRKLPLMKMTMKKMMILLFLLSLIGSNLQVESLLLNLKPVNNFSTRLSSQISIS
ncbi:hypothetical protein CsatA_005516 [Cannabis sativa]